MPVSATRYVLRKKVRLSAYLITVSLLPKATHRGKGTQQLLGTFSLASQ